MNLHNYYIKLNVWSSAHPFLALFLVLLLACSESLPLLGSFIPGSVSMTFIGILTGTNVLPLYATIFFAILGAVLGDSIAFFIGKNLSNSILQIWPFNRRPQLIDKAKKFIIKHGGKSILIGRFIGILRPMIPMIVGLLKMRIINFYIIDFLSAIIWAIIYIIPGFAMGRLSLQVPPALASKFVVIILTTLAILWLFSILFNKLILLFHYLGNILANKIWYKLKQNNKLYNIRWLFKSANKQHSKQLFLAILLLLSLFTFIIFSFFYIQNANFITIINEDVFHLFRGIQQPILHKLAIIISATANYKVIISTSFVIMLYLLQIKEKRTALHIFLLLFISLIIAFLLKHFVQIIRPNTVSNLPLDFSYPSGHVFLACVIYGFFTYLIINGKFQQYRSWIFRIIITFILILAICRLYLCLHWLADIIGAILLSIPLLLLAIISHRRRNCKNPMKYLFVIVFVSILLFSNIYLYFNFKQQVNDYRIIWPKNEINIKNWWQQQNTLIPLYRNNLLRKPDQILNLQWVANLKNIKQSLIASNWKLLNNKSLITFMTGKTIFTKLQNDQLPVLIASKIINKNKTFIIFLWDSNIKIMPQNIKLFVGSFYSIYGNKKTKIYTKKLITHNVFLDLNNYYRTNIHISRNELPLKFNNLFTKKNNYHFEIMQLFAKKHMN